MTKYYAVTKNKTNGLTPRLGHLGKASKKFFPDLVLSTEGSFFVKFFNQCFGGIIQKCYEIQKK